LCFRLIEERGIFMSLMNNLSKLAKSVGDNASNVAKKSADMIELTKLNLAIQAEEDKIKLAHNEIGAIIFAKFNSGEAVDPDIIQYCNSIIEVQNQISAVQLKISKLKNTRICEKCGHEIILSSVFCPKCGEKQPIEESVPEPVIVVQETKEKICSTCNTKIEDESTYCPGCGKSV
jgi:rRNA maturation endonuclease Nob1